MIFNNSLVRWGFDLVSGYKSKPIPPGSNMSLEELRKGGYCMDEHGWLNVRSGFRIWRSLAVYVFLQRILFLESIAGVPGMVAATVRHLRSLRLMVGRDVTIIFKFYRSSDCRGATRDGSIHF